jgi:hypothetical protein
LLSPREQKAEREFSSCFLKKHHASTATTDSREFIYYYRFTGIDSQQGEVLQ